MHSTINKSFIAFITVQLLTYIIKKKKLSHITIHKITNSSRNFYICFNKMNINKNLFAMTPYTIIARNFHECCGHRKLRMLYNILFSR